MLTDVLYVNFREIISGMHDSRGVISAVTSIAAAIFVCVIREHSCLAALMTCERVLLISENSKKGRSFQKAESQFTCAALALQRHGVAQLNSQHMLPAIRGVPTAP
jgi:hypothetical protein